MHENNTQLLPSFRWMHVLNIQIGQHAIPLWYIAILLISGIGSGVLTYYAWPRKTTPSDVIVPDNDSLESCHCSCIYAYKFRYFNYSGDKLWNYPAGIASYSVPSRTDIAFGIALVNLDPSGESLVLNRYSCMWIYFLDEMYTLNIVNAEPDGTITTPYTPISIAYCETKTLVFAKVSFGLAVENSHGMLNLMLVGKLGPNDYGKNIPIGPLYVYNPYT